MNTMNIAEIRYDLSSADFFALDLASADGLLKLAAKWRAGRDDGPEVVYILPTAAERATRVLGIALTLTFDQILAAYPGARRRDA